MKDLRTKHIRAGIHAILISKISNFSPKIPDFSPLHRIFYPFLHDFSPFLDGVHSSALDCFMFAAHLQSLFVLFIGDRRRRSESEFSRKASKSHLQDILDFPPLVQHFSQKILDFPQFLC